MASLLPLRMLGRNLFVQASWSFERLQGPGFFLTVLPALRSGDGDRGAERTAAAARHLEVFNTHPYFSGLVAATVAREEAAGGDGGQLAAGLKRSLMCALGGIGDDFFWAHLRPAAALAAALPALAGSPWAVAVLLVVYNLPHLAARIGGIALGLSRGRGVLTMLQAPVLARLVPALAAVIPALAGLAGGYLAAGGAWAAAPPGGVAGAAAPPLAFVAALALVSRGGSPGALVGAAAAVALAAGLAGEVVAP